MNKLIIPTILLFLSITVIAAVFIEPQSLPSKTGYTLQDIDNLITDNLTIPGNYTLSTTSIPSYSNKPSVSNIYAKLFNLLNPDDLRSGVTYLGVTGGQTRSSTINVPVSSFNPTTDIGAQGYTLQDIYNLIHNSTTNTFGNHSVSTSSLPRNSMYSLTDLYNDLLDLIPAGDIKSGITYLGTEGTYVSSGYALNLNGDGSYFSVLPNPSFEVQQLTLNIWVNVNDTYSHSIIQYGKGAGQSWGIGFCIGWECGDNTIGFSWFKGDQGGWHYLTSLDSFPVNEWHMVTVTYDGSYVRLYIDGVENNSLEYSYGFDYDSVAGLFVGAYYIPSGITNFLEGRVDEALIFNRPLSINEIEYLYNDGVGVFGDISDTPFNDGLISGYHFDNDLNDFSGNGYDGVFSSSADYTTGIVLLP